MFHRLCTCIIILQDLELAQLKIHQLKVELVSIFVYNNCYKKDYNRTVLFLSEGKVRE